LRLSDGEAGTHGEPSTERLMARFQRTGDAKAFGEVAARCLPAAGDPAAAFLVERLKPDRAGPARLRTLIAQLSSDRYATRRSASKQLSRLGRAAEPALRAALRSDLSAEARERVAQLLGACAVAHPALPGARRVARAVRVLELIRTQQAVKLLESLARGTRKAHATEQARAALRRIRSP